MFCSLLCLNLCCQPKWSTILNVLTKGYTPNVWPLALIINLSLFLYSALLITLTTLHTSLATLWAAGFVDTDKAVIHNDLLWWTHRDRKIAEQWEELRPSTHPVFAYSHIQECHLDAKWG